MVKGKSNACAAGAVRTENIVAVVSTIARAVAYKELEVVYKEPENESDLSALFTPAALKFLFTTQTLV
jgi:hypothetical protein